MTAREFFKTPKGKLILLCCILMPVSWIFLLLQFSGDLSTLFPDGSRKAELEKEIKKLKGEYQTQQKRLNEYETLKKQYRDKVRNAWQFDKDGDPELILRQKIESTAKESELLLSNLGSVRVSRASSELAWAELDISTSGEFETVIRFLDRVRSLKPEISWRRLTINQMFRRSTQQNATTVRNAANSSSRVVSNTNTAKANTTVTSVFLNGTVRVLFYDGGAGQ